MAALAVLNLSNHTEIVMGNSALRLAFIAASAALAIGVASAPRAEPAPPAGGPQRIQPVRPVTSAPAPPVLQAQLPAVHSKGILRIFDGSGADFDALSLDAGSANDLEFKHAEDNATLWYIIARNGAAFGDAKTQPHGYLGCVNAAFKPNGTFLLSVAMGRHICIRTNQGRIGEIWLRQLEYVDAKQRITVDATTWGD